MTQKTPALDNQAIDDLFVASALSGFIVWPIAFGGAAWATAASEQDWQSAWYGLFASVLAACLLTVVPVLCFMFVKRTTARLGGYGLAVWLGLAAVSIFGTLISNSAPYLGLILIAQLIALLPSCFCSVVLVGIVLRSLKALRAQSLLSFVLGGFVGGFLPAIPMIAFVALTNGHVTTLTSTIAGILGFWCIGGMAAMITVWIWWQVQRKRGAKEALEHPPSDLPEPQLQP
jgi:hypothetical protein